MKLPKTIQILNYTFEIKRSKEYYGHFEFSDNDNEGKPTITITNDKVDNIVLEVFLHEVLEIILELTRVRYVSPDEDGNYEFHYTHKQHDTVSKILAQALMPMFKEVN